MTAYQTIAANPDTPRTPKIDAPLCLCLLVSEFDQQMVADSLNLLAQPIKAPDNVHHQQEDDDVVR
jgi:hypothetical protein